jgi:CheY-like chemotaxis protein
MAANRPVTLGILLAWSGPMPLSRGRDPDSEELFETSIIEPECRAHRPSPKSTTGTRYLVRPSVLIVEDEVPAGRLLGAALRSDRWDVRAACTAEEALGLLQTFRPHIAIIDLILPRMSGLLLARILKVDLATRDIIVIAATSLHGLETERLAREFGCAAIIYKPADPLAVRQLLADQLSGSR